MIAIAAIFENFLLENVGYFFPIPIVYWNPIKEPRKTYALKYRCRFRKYENNDFGSVPVPIFSNGSGFRTASFRYGSDPGVKVYNKQVSELEALKIIKISA